MKNIEIIRKNNNKIECWSQLQSLLEDFKNVDEIQNDTNFYDILDTVLINFTSLIEKAEEEDVPKFEILESQLKLYKKEKQCYDTSSMVLAFIMFSYSKSAYNILNRFFKFPTVRHLQRLTSKFNLSPNYKHPENDEKYFSFVSQNFIHREKYVMIAIDEVHVSKLIQFKGNNLFGFSFNKPNEIATSIVAFMVSTPFGNKKEVVRLIPVTNLTGDLQRDYLLEVIDFVQSRNIKVILVMTDNHRLNQSMFKLLANNFFENPKYNGSLIYLAFDPVHLMKSIRNNWLCAPEKKNYLF